MDFGKIDLLEKPVSRLVLGTMIIDSQQQERSSALLDAAVAHGITTLDTAHIYAGGWSERGIGNWMEERGNREELVILTKGALPNDDRARVTPYDITSDLHDSLARLKTDYVDIYLLHRDDISVPVGPIVETLNEHKEAGKIRTFGGSNWTHDRIQEANDYAASKGLQGFTASSPNYSLAEQVDNPWGPGCVTIGGKSEKPARDWYAQSGMGIFAYSSLARGMMTGRLTRENYQELADDACRTAYCHEENFLRLDRLQKLAPEKDLTVAELALAWVLSQNKAAGLNVFAIVGTANEAEIQSCLKALEASTKSLAPAELAWLNLESEAL